MPGSLKSENSAAGGFAPFGQLVRMLLPSARSVAIYDPRAELIWCSDGYEHPDLRELLEQQRATDTVASRGRVEATKAGIPVFVSGLRAADERPLGSLVIELGGGNGARSIPSMVVSMLRPVLDCLEARLDLEHTARIADRSAGLELLLSVDEQGREDASALHELLRHSVRELGCVTGALLVPDKNLEFAYTLEESLERSQLLDRTQKHLLAWVRLNNRPMIVNRGGNGADTPYKILSCPLRDAGGGVVGLLALFRTGGAQDFEQRDVRILEFVGRKAVAVLHSEYDSLTGLINPAIFERRGQRCLEQGPVSVLYVDIDKVAAINDAFGLGAGDEMIQRVASVIQRIAGPPALVSRIAGDRFAVVLPQRPLGEATEVGAATLAAASQLGFVQGADALPVSVSIGAAVGARGERLAHLLAAAELACKRAKREGGGRLVAVEDAAQQAAAPSRQLLAAAEIENALRSNQFVLDAQPIVGLRARTGQTVGYELLVRLRNAAGETLAPDKFLDACADYGLMPALDRWVFCAAVDVLRAHVQSLAATPMFFALNVSVQSLESRKYPAFVLETLANAGLPPSLFCFELKETAAVANLPAADTFIRELTNAGARVALDDFGAGLSSLAFLKQLPVGYLKIDGRFVRRIAVDRVAESIVSGIARAARTLGIMTIAEHVEAPAVAEQLRDLEVTFGQGFELGRPAPFAQLMQESQSVAPLARLTRA